MVSYLTNIDVTKHNIDYFQLILCRYYTYESTLFDVYEIYKHIPD